MPARSDIDQHLAREGLLPVYAFVGGEPFLVSEAVRTLRSATLTAAADFNCDAFRAGQTPIAHILDAARTLPMMAERRWVQLSDVHKLSVKDQESLLRYVEKPSVTTVLCLCGEKLDMRRKLGARLSKDDAVFTLAAPKQQALGAWIRGRARHKNVEIDPEAAALLADLSGPELGALDLSIEKLALYAGVGQRILTEHVEALTAPTRTKSIFELTEAIGQRDFARASLLMRNALSGGDKGLAVLAMVARQLRHVLQVKVLRAEGKRPQEIATTVGVRPFLVPPLTEQAERYTVPELWKALDAVRRADIRFKSTRLDAGVILDRLLVEMMSP